MSTPTRRLHKDLLVAPLGEALLLLIVAAVGLLTRQPLLFASLGPTAYELIETPTRPSARPYNILVGHLIGVLSGLLALRLTHAAAVPAVSDLHALPLARVEAAVLAATLTVFGTLLLRAMQPAAVSTTLLITLGAMQRWQDCLLILAAVLLLTIVGEPLRRWRLRSSPSYTEADFARRP